MNRAKREVPDVKEWKSVDMVSDTEDGPERAGNQDSNGGGDSTDNGMSIDFDLDDDVVVRWPIRSDTRVRLSHQESELNSRAVGEKGVNERIEEMDKMLKRRRGQKRADEREILKYAARKGVAFGFVVSGDGMVGERRV